MAASLADILASLDNGVRAINNLALQVTNSLTNIPVPLSALSTDAYAAGAWTPVPTFATPGDLVANGIFIGNYTMVGRLVYANFNLVSTTFTFTTSSGRFQVTGLPFTSNGSFIEAGSFSHFTGITTFPAGLTFASPRVEVNNSLFDIAMMGTAPTTLANSTGNFTSGTNILLRGFVLYTTSVST